MSSHCPRMLKALQRCPGIPGPAVGDQALCRWSRVQSAWSWLGTALALLWVLTAFIPSTGWGQNGGREVLTRPTLLVSLVEGLQSAPAAARAAFVRIALGEMVLEYESVLDSAPTQARPQSDRQIAWNRATADYLSRLRQALRNADEGLPVEIGLSGRRSVQVLVAGEPIIIAGPIIDHPHEMERRIVEQYCLEAFCPSTASGIGRVGLPPRLVWSFGDDRVATLSTTDGVHCQFRDASDRWLKERACVALTREMRELARALQDAAGSGFQVDWRSLRIRSGGPNDLARVEINDRGDFVRLLLPELSRLWVWPPEVSDWLRYRSMDRTYQLVLADADRLLAKPGSP